MKLSPGPALSLLSVMSVVNISNFCLVIYIGFIVYFC